MKTQEKILNAAMTLLTENGFQALTQTRVADIAGVTQGNLTYHFPTRNDLLKAVVEECKTRMSQTRAAELETDLTWSSFEAMMLAIPFSKTMPDLMLALTVARDEDPTLAEWFAQHDLNTRQNFRRILTKLGYQVDEATLHFMRSAILGAAMIHLQQNSTASEEIAKSIMKSACDYLKQKAVPITY